MHQEARQGHGHVDYHDAAIQNGTSSQWHQGLQRRRYTGINELDDALVVEPVSDGGVLLDSFAMS